MNYNTERKKRINISNEFYKNYTFKYLITQLTTMDKGFIQAFDKLKTYAWGIGDYGRPDLIEDPLETNNLYVLVNKNSNLSYFHDYTSYVYQDGNWNKIMLVIPLPIDNRLDFIKGNYTKMYSKDLITNNIPNTIYQNGIEIENPLWGVMHKTEERLELFKEQVKQDFEVEYVTKDVEYDYPPFLNNEIFNYDYRRNEQRNRETTNSLVGAEG